MYPRGHAFLARRWLGEIRYPCESPLSAEACHGPHGKLLPAMSIFGALLCRALSKGLHPLPPGPAPLRLRRTFLLDTYLTFCSSTAPEGRPGSQSCPRGILLAGSLNGIIPNICKHAIVSYTERSLRIQAPRPKFSSRETVQKRIARWDQDERESLKTTSSAPVNGASDPLLYPPSISRNSILCLAGPTRRSPLWRCRPLAVWLDTPP